MKAGPGTVGQDGHMKVVAVAGAKGGIGKTATAVNLAMLSSQAGFRTLLWDLDPQGAATHCYRAKAKVKGSGETRDKVRGGLDREIKDKAGPIKEIRAKDSGEIKVKDLTKAKDSTRDKVGAAKEIKDLTQTKEIKDLTQTKEIKDLIPIKAKGLIQTKEIKDLILIKETRGLILIKEIRDLTQTKVKGLIQIKAKDGAIKDLIKVTKVSTRTDNTGAKTHISIKTQTGAQAASRVCPAGKTNSIATFLQSSSVVTAGNAEVQECGSTTECKSPVAHATRDKAFVLSAMVEASIS